MNWIIGSSSAYSKQMAQQLNDVMIFGRHNLDYTQFNMQQYGMPKRVFLNINFEAHTEQQPTAGKSQWISGITQYAEIIYWKKKLYEYLSTSTEPVAVCDVTSSITKWPQDYMNNQQYSIFRAMQQTLAKGYQNDINIFGVCPNGICEDVAYDYARLTVNLLNRAPEEYTIYNLANGGSEI